MFDQAPNVACIASREVMAGAPILTVVHFEDDHSWAFSGEGGNDPTRAMVVAMSEVLAVHHDLTSVADLLPGWIATRSAAAEAWQRKPEQP